MGDIYLGRDYSKFDTLLRYLPSSLYVDDPATVFEFILYMNEVETKQVQKQIKAEKDKLERKYAKQNKGNTIKSKG